MANFKLRSITPGIVGGALLLGMAPALAQSHPDFTGMWQFEFSNFQPLVAHPPALTPAAQKIVATKQAKEKQGYVRGVQNILCLPTAFPMLMMWRSPIEIMAAPGRISIITEHDPGNDEPRTLYLNETKHPDDADESWNGHSIAHWEGNALVVDTIDFNERGDLFGGIPRSEKTHIVEHISLAKGGKQLIDHMTIEDPTSLKAPWPVDMVFDRLPDSTERLEAVCEPDLDALKSLDLNAMKDVDSEAARLLDPSEHYNAVGNQFSKETK